MKNIPIRAVLHSVKTSLVKHSPELLTGVGIAGMITATVLAVKATPKAIQAIEAAAEEKGCEVEELKVTEKVKACWKCYIPAAATSATSAACLIGANSVNGRRNAALATAYSISETARREYEEAVHASVGEEEHKKIQEHIAESRLKDRPSEDHEVTVTGKGTTLCFEPLSSRYFYSSQEAVRQALIGLNESLLTDPFYGNISLNEYFDALGLEHTQTGELLGWCVDMGRLKYDFHAKITDRGEPALVIDIKSLPEPNYYK